MENVLPKLEDTGDWRRCNSFRALNVGVGMRGSQESSGDDEGCCVCIANPFAGIFLRSFRLAGFTKTFGSFAGGCTAGAGPDSSDSVIEGSDRVRAWRCEFERRFAPCWALSWLLYSFAPPPPFPCCALSLSDAQEKAREDGIFLLVVVPVVPISGWLVFRLTAPLLIWLNRFLLVHNHKYDLDM